MQIGLQHLEHTMQQEAGACNLGFPSDVPENAETIRKPHGLSHVSVRPGLEQPAGLPPVCTKPEDDQIYFSASLLIKAHLLGSMQEDIYKETKQARRPPWLWEKGREPSKCT